MPLQTFIILIFLVFSSTVVYSEDMDTSKDVMPLNDVPAELAEPAYSIKKIFAYIPPLKKGPDEKKWFYSFSGWYGRNLGNTDNLTSNFKTKLQRDDNISDFEISFAAFYGKSDGERNEKKSEGIIKYDHYIIPRVELFAFSKSEYNKMALLDHRNNSGTGSKLVFVKSKYLKLDLSGAITHQFENYESERPETEYRWSFRFRTGVYPVKGLKLSYIYFYIPKIDDRKMYRTELDTYISYELNDYFSFKVGYINKYNRDALEGTKKTDENFYAQVSLDL